MQNKNDEKPVDDPDGEKSECPYKNGQNNEDNDAKGSTKLEEVVKEAEEATTLSQESTTGLASGRLIEIMLGLKDALNCLIVYFV